MDDVESRVVNFLSNFCSVKSEEMLFDKSIRDDFGVDGDDASLLLDEYSKLFCVNVSGVDFGLYFGYEEPVSLFGLFSINIRGRRKTPVFVYDFIEGARSGELKPGRTGQLTRADKPSEPE